MTPSPGRSPSRAILAVACLLILATYTWMIDLKGISTDEGIRLAIINGGAPFVVGGNAAQATWARVLETNAPYAYQPFYFLLQNTLMRLAGSQDVLFFRSINIVFLGVSLLGLVALSAGWRLGPRLFLLGLFSFNAYLFMHVLQIREYIVGVAFYIWSTWLVLHLDRRPLLRPWTDSACFAGYGLLLVIGFFTQTWVVFPAIGQGLFLVLRSRGDRVRFLAHLALSYVIVLSVARPYLEAHQQKINVGLWASEHNSLWSHLSDGFHLVLTGHLAGQFRFTEFLFWFWTIALGLGAGLLLRPPAPADPAAADDRRSALLLAVCSLVPLAFQISYYYKVENLSVWPRYFIIHYFFITALLALGFRRVDGLCRTPAGSGVRQFAPAARGALLLGLLGSGVFQVWSYYRDPYLDTGVSRESDWRVIAGEFSRALRPADVVVARDFIVRSTLTFTRPLAQPVAVLPTLAAADVSAAARVLYLEPAEMAAERPAVLARLAALGFPVVHEIPLHTADGQTRLAWQILACERR